MKKSRLLGAMRACLITFSISTVANATIIDQEFDAHIIQDNQLLQVTNNVDLGIAQTFTVGVTGNLTTVDALIFRRSHVVASGFLTMDIRKTVYAGSTLGYVPVQSNSGSDVLAQVTIPMTSLHIWDRLYPGIPFTTFDISGFNVSVTEGEILSLTLRHDSPLSWSGSNLDLYSRGAFYLRGNSTGFWTFLGSSQNDMSFRTYVTPIPIPPALWLFGSGLLGLIGISRKQ